MSNQCLQMFHRNDCGGRGRGEGTHEVREEDTSLRDDCGGGGGERVLMRCESKCMRGTCEVSQV